jgi:hypothetical protein
LNWRRVKIWFFISFTLAVIGIVIRAVWQIVVIPTAGTMLIFIPLIIALLGMDALFAYLTARPDKMKSRWFAAGVTVMFTAGLIAGVAHFARFITSENAKHFLSKVIGAFVLSSSLSAYFLILYILWSYRRTRKNGRREV